MSFDRDFVWGAASAAYQIEGGAFEDGKGPSIWDHYSHIPGKTFNNQTGDVAADAYHRYEEDLDLLAELGIKNYRFSISWSRIFPTGETSEWDGTLINPPKGLNPSGLDYYDRLIDGCISRGIAPWVTLYHWDLPLALYHKGGWFNRETAYHFARYTEFFALHFKNRVNRYITVNEPQCAIGMGMCSGQHAPGLKLDPDSSFRAWHHLMLAHGLAARKIKETVPDAVIGIASTGELTYITRSENGLKNTPAVSPNLSGTGYPLSTPEGLAEAAFFSKKGNPGHFFNHQWYMDPVLLGHYPDDHESPWYPYRSFATEDDLGIISAPIDFIGLNIYNGRELIYDEAGKLTTAPKYDGYPRTALKWPVTPEVMYWGPRLIWERYKKPVFIMENGQSCNDRIFLDGQVHDPDRIDFLHRYLTELKKSCEDGVPVKGYFHWSFTDNYEWHSGYDDRFGLVFVDYRDQRRIVKDSARWYSDVIRENGENL